MNLNVISMKHMVCVAFVFALLGCRNSEELGKSPGEQIEALKTKVEKLEGKINSIETQFGVVTGSALSPH